MAKVQPASSDSPLAPEDVRRFQSLIREQGRLLYRDLPWRNTRDPYGIWLSEVMLQQTQVVRGIQYWERWLERFPTVDALAAASLPDVLEMWQGLGYNRRALMLHKAAGIVSAEFGGIFPHDKPALLALPGVGPATAAGIRVFAFDEPDVYLETNVRAVFLHEFKPDKVDVPDRDIIPLIEATCPVDDVRGWYYALLDYGAHLKATMVNPSRRSRGHVRQSTFEGSRRQKRAWLLRAVMVASEGEGNGGASVGSTLEGLARELNSAESKAGRGEVEVSEVGSILSDLVAEGFIVCEGERYSVAR